MGPVEKRTEAVGLHPKFALPDRTRRLQIFGELLIAKAAELAGRVIAPLDWKWMRERIGTFDLYIRGLEHLAILNTETAIIAGNHLLPIPSPRLPVSLERSAVGPDSFIIKKIVEEATRGMRKMWFAGHFDMENRLLESAGRGFYRGHNAIPVTKRQGAFNRELISEAKVLFARGDILHMYPEGRQSADFDPVKTLYTGTATIARRYGQKIIPYYIRGATSWKKGQKVEVAFGPPIPPEGKTKVQITMELHDAMTMLQKSVKEHPAF